MTYMLRNVDPEIMKRFGERAHRDGMSKDDVAKALMQLYADGKLSLPERAEEK